MKEYILNAFPSPFGVHVLKYLAQQADCFG